MDAKEKIELHIRMSEAYKNAYLTGGAQSGSVKGATWEAWKFAKGSLGRWPYFTGDSVMQMESMKMAPGLGEKEDMAAKSAAMEATAYAISFPNWKCTEFKVYPAQDGFVQLVRWEGLTKNATKTDGTPVPDGTKYGFFSYSFVDTNDKGEITRWETHTNHEFGDFLDIALHNRGPFKGFEYQAALAKRLKGAGIVIK
jgi:hypothetical protein